MHRPKHDDLCLRYLAGELPAAEAEVYREHREGCADCAELTRTLGTGTRAAALASVSLSAEACERLAEEVLAAAEPERPVASPPARWRTWSLGAALAVLAVWLFVARPRPPAYDELVWTNGIEKDIRRLDGELVEIDDALEFGAAAEMDLELERLERESRWIKGEIKGG